MTERERQTLGRAPSSAGTSSRSATTLRPFTLGGSDAAAACGIDPFRSRIMLWAELTGRVTREPTEAMEWGTRLEPVIDDAMTDRGYEIIPAPADGFTDPERPWLVGHPDGFTPRAARAVYERKTMGQWAHRANGSGAAVPLPYQAQAQVYMHLTGCAETVVATLVGGQRLEVGIVERDDRAIEGLLALMDAFRGYVRRDRPPPPDGSDSAKAAVVALFPEHTPAKLYRLSRAEWELLKELRALREQAATIAEQIAARENVLKLAAGDAEVAISPHDTDAFTWRHYQARRIDTKALREARPEIASEFEKVTSTRRFTLA